MLNLDTHILLFALVDELTKRERHILAKEVWSISAIVLWEITMLAKRDRIEYDIDSAEMSSLLNRVHVWPLDRRVCVQLKSLDFSGDPADEIIAATSLAHDLPLITRDRRIRQSRLLQFAGV